MVPGGPSGPLSDPSYLTLVRIAAWDLGPAPGVAAGLSYPLAKDLDGLYSPLSASVLLHLPALDGDGRANWMRDAGGARRRAERRRRAPPGSNSSASADGSAAEPPLRRRLSRAVRLVAALGHGRPAMPAPPSRYVSRAADPVADVIAERPVVHHPGARVTLGEETPDRIEIDVWGDGGLLVLRRAFQPLFQASAGGRPLPTLPVNLSLLGVEVPPGNHRVWIEVGAGPEALAGGVALVAFLGALVLAFPMKRLW